MTFVSNHRFISGSLGRAGSPGMFGSPGAEGMKKSLGLPEHNTRSTRAGLPAIFVKGGTS